MKNKLKKLIVGILMIMLFLQGCTTMDTSDVRETTDKIQVVATTTLIADLIEQIGGDHVDVESLMGPGIDPHGYQATARDNTRIFNAHIVAYNGLDLEGQMGEVFSVLSDADKTVIVIEEGIHQADLLASADIDSAYDPHIWFDVNLWKDAATHVTEELKAYDPFNSIDYERNNENYQTDLDRLDAYIKGRVEEVPEDRRYLITAHDAFSYFGEAYGFEVIGIQGLNTQTEAGTGDISRLAIFMTEKELKALFIETSVSTRNIEALMDAVKARGHQVELGGELFSDSLGDVDQNAETYIKMYRRNIDTIVDSLN